MEIDTGVVLGLLFLFSLKGRNIPIAYTSLSSEKRWLNDQLISNVNFHTFFLSGTGI